MPAIATLGVGALYEKNQDAGAFEALLSLAGHQHPAVLDALGPLTKLRQLNLYDTTFTDADLERLRGLASLQVLNLAATQVTDAGLPCLQTLPTLRELNLNDTHVTDAGLRSLQGLPRLRVLGLYRARVTDEGLAELGSMKNLQELTLGSSSITDRGLAAADIFLQTAPEFVSLAANHPDPERRRVARDFFARTLEFAAECGSRHVSALPGVYFEEEPQADSFARC